MAVTTINNDLTLGFQQTTKKIIKVKQYDKNTRVVTFNFIDSAGKPLELFDGSIMEVYFRMGTPDGRKIFNEDNVKINGNSSVVLTLDDNMLAVSGRAKGEIDIYYQSGEKLSTTVFDLIIEAASVSDEAIEKSDEYSALNNLIAKNLGLSQELNVQIELVKSLNEQVTTAEASRTSAENSRVDAENTRVSEFADLKSDMVEAINMQNDAADRAKESATNAKTSETNASSSASSAKSYAATATDQATLAKSYAVGGTNTRTGEDVDNAKYYKEQSSSSATASANSASAASSSATNAKNYSDSANTYATNASTSATSANASATAAASSATSADSSANTAKTKATEAITSASSASTSATNAKTSETNANNSASKASTSATNAKTSETSAAESATTASEQAVLAESYAKGGTNTRTREDTDNAKYYKEQAATSATSASNSASTATTQATSAKNSATSASTSASNASTSATSAAASATNASNSATNASNSADEASRYVYQCKQISEGLKGGLLPMGTVTFEDLPPLADVGDGWEYNISNEFTTTSDFVEGAGYVIPLGSNIYKTTDGKWDVLAGSPVAGVKGNAETSYRIGNVNITPANIGLGNVNNTSDSNKSVKYATSSGSATSATKATQDGSGNNIVNTYAKKNDNTDANGLMNALTVGTSDPTDSDYYISQYAGGGTTNVTYHRKPLSALWSWIKGKLATVAISGNYADLAGKPTQMPASDVYSWAKQSTKPTYTASEVGALSSSGNAVSATKASKLSNTSAIGSTTKPVYFTANGVPSACTYSLGKSVPSDAKFTDTNTWRPVYNGLDSTSTDTSLSAAQGKILNDSLILLHNSKCEQLNGKTCTVGETISIKDITQYDEITVTFSLSTDTSLLFVSTETYPAEPLRNNLGKWLYSTGGNLDTRVQFCFPSTTTFKVNGGTSGIYMLYVYGKKY